jgi:hypothetical protein
MGAVRNDKAGAGEKPHCPHCEDIELRRQGRVGFWQRAVLSRLGLYPWECGLCRKIYFLRQRATDYRQHSTEAGVSSARLEFIQAPAPRATADRPLTADRPRYDDGFRKQG